MRNKKLSTYTFIVDFRDGTHCSQVQVEDANKSVSAWLKQIENEQDQIKYLVYCLLDKTRIFRYKYSEDCKLMTYW